MSKIATVVLSVSMYVQLHVPHALLHTYILPMHIHASGLETKGKASGRERVNKTTN